MSNDARLDSLFRVMREELGDYCLNLGPSRSLVAARRQMDRLRKKAIFDNVDHSVNAVCDFINLNCALESFTVETPEDVLTEARFFILRALENVTTEFNESNVQYSFDWLLLYDLWGFGPGACASGLATHPVEKFLSSWDCTHDAMDLVKKLRRGHPYLSTNDRFVGDCHPFLTQGSRLSTVPKNEETFRTIGMEPIGNMALQLAAGRYLEKALRSVGLDIRQQQPRNKAAAKRGSVDGTLCTIDLKNASDMIKPELVQKLLPPEWYDLLMKIRSPRTLLPDGSYLELNMISTMGNGFTFPLMTLIFCSLIYGMRRLKGGPNLYIDWRHTCVFGDDIIVPTSEYSELCSLLESSCLIVNHDKSFFEGPFRESCGGDYMYGVDITPFYVKRLRDNADIYVAINQVLEWYGRTNVLLYRSLDLLLSFLGGKPFLVPEWSDFTSGIKTTLVGRRYKCLVPLRSDLVLPNDSPYITPLCVGGYVTSRGEDLLYAPRQLKTRYVVFTSRIPEGFRNGRHPSRDASASRSIDLYLLMRGLSG